MSQKEELIAMMEELQNYLRSHSVFVTTEEIYDSFREYGLDSDEKNKLISDSSKKEIYSMLEQKRSERKCYSLYEPINEGWNFFWTNNSGEKRNYQWKVYIPIKSEHYGFVVKNVIAFLSDNGIVSECKVSGSMRSDSLVVNLENEEDVTKLNAICMKCGGLATRTQRIIDGLPAYYDDPVILVGANDSYEARCRSCHEVLIRGKK